MPTPTHRRKLWGTLAKVTVLVVVLVFVGRSVAGAGRQLATQRVRPHAGYLAASGAAYLLGLAPMAWFWRRALAGLGQPCRWRDVLPAYYLGHLGKYVPGKAMVVVLRTGAIHRAGGETAPVAASAVVETLTMMAVGAVVASLLLALLGAREVDLGWLAPLAVSLAVIAAAPTLPPVMRRLLPRLAPRSAASAAGITWKLIAAGWFAGLMTWLGMAASLWLAVRSLDDGVELSVEATMRCALAVTLPVVAGFLSLLPGGLLVRDGLMFALLKPLAGLAEPTALAATLLLRLTWVVSEAFACVMLTIGRKLAGVGSQTARS
ncbi:MAG: lysylphosphatidylglycerol synthase domain-containing protein [Planctomycetota bacterium]